MADTTVGKLSSEYLEELQNSLKSNANKRKTDLGKDEFLQLLMVQLTTQDPLEPMTDTDFIAQMAQFSALEQMNTLSNSMLMNNAYGMIGKTVSYTDPKSGGEALGTVSAVFAVSGQPRLQVGDYVLTLSDVISVYDNNLFDMDSAYNMVGKYVSYKTTGEDGKETEVTGKVTSAFAKDGLPYVKVDGKEVSLSDIAAVHDASEFEGAGTDEAILAALNEQNRILQEQSKAGADDALTDGTAPVEETP